MNLLNVTKDGETLAIHPSTLAAHQSVGWLLIGPADATHESADTNGDDKVSADELRDALAAAGVTHDKPMTEAQARRKWGLSRKEWNNLADADKAARMAGAE